MSDIDKIMEFIADIVTEADVDFPAGRDAGPRVSYDEHKIRAHIQAALDRAETEINIKADFINNLLNKMEQAEEAHQAALAAPNRHAYKVGIAVGKASAEADAAARVEAMPESVMVALEYYASGQVDAPIGWLARRAIDELRTIHALPSPAPMTVQAAAKVPEIAALIHALAVWRVAFQTGRNEPLQIAFETGQAAIAAITETKP
jgi:hypothetical protein